MRILTWNMKGAKASRQAAWEYLLELRPDIALLQEVGELPLWVARDFEHHAACAVRRDGTPQRFRSATLVRGRIGGDLSFPTGREWVRREMARFRGNIPAHRLEPVSGPAIHAVNVYSPAWELDRSQFRDVDTSGVRLTQQPQEVWLGDLLWSCLPAAMDGAPGLWVIAGDFNLSETFDASPSMRPGSGEYLQRMSGLGLVECLRHSAGRVVPTFRNADGGGVLHQLDHMFLNQPLAAALERAWAGDEARVFGGRLSDHLPIIAEFSLNAG